MFDIVLINIRNNIFIFFIFIDIIILNVYSRCFFIECGIYIEFVDYFCKFLFFLICSNLGENIDCFLIFFFNV